MVPKTVEELSEFYLQRAIIEKELIECAKKVAVAREWKQSDIDELDSPEEVYLRENNNVVIRYSYYAGCGDTDTDYIEFPASYLFDPVALAKEHDIWLEKRKKEKEDLERRIEEDKQKKAKESEDKERARYEELKKKFG